MIHNIYIKDLILLFQAKAQPVMMDWSYSVKHERVQEEQKIPFKFFKLKKNLIGLIFFLFFFNVCSFNVLLHYLLLPLQFQKYKKTTAKFIF